MEAVLEIESVAKAFDEKPVLKDISFSLETGSIGCLLGPSGCGKTTALRIIAGFECPDRGEIQINRQTVAKSGYFLPPEKRKIGMVFQDYALFPHLTVFDNIGFGLLQLSGRDKKRRIDKMLELVGLNESWDHYPHELSGGQQQRVALARALAPQPELMLMDEPFSNLDVSLRERLSMEVRDILKTSNTSALIVTHNQQEAFAMADVIGVLTNGQLQQWDTAYNLYHRPANRVVADFIGEGVLLLGKVTGLDQVGTGLGILNGPFSYPCRNGCPAHVLIRPEDVVHDHNSRFKARIKKKTFRGANILYTLELPSTEKVMALVPSHHNHTLGQEIGILPQVDEIILFDR